MKAIVFLNGEFPKDREFYKKLNIDEKHLYCADGGAKKALELGLTPKEVWGDFDSLSKLEVESLERKNVVLNRFHKDKDFTDGELLIKYLSEKEYEEIIVIGGTGGRTDHFFTNLNLIFIYPKLKFVSEKEVIFLVKNGERIREKKGSTVSFIPFSDEVIDLTLKGFKFPLDRYLLKRGSSICISNIIVDEEGVVEYRNGKLIGIINDEI